MPGLEVGPYGGTFSWDPKVGLYDGSLRWDLRVTRRSSHSKLFFKTGVLKHFAIFTGKHLCWSLFIINETPTHVFSCEYYEIFKSSFLYKITLVAASGDVSKTVKKDGMILSMKIHCLKEH